MFVGKGKGENRILKEFVWRTIFKIFPPKYLVVRRTTRSQFLVVLTHFLSSRTRGHANFATLRILYMKRVVIFQEILFLVHQDQPWSLFTHVWLLGLNYTLSLYKKKILQFTSVWRIVRSGNDYDSASNQVVASLNTRGQHYLYFDLSLIYIISNTILNDRSKYR